MRRKERTLLSAVGAPDVEGANPGQALSAGSAVGDKQYAAGRESGPGFSGVNALMCSCKT